jgi:hypothetical protein
MEPQAAVPARGHVVPTWPGVDIFGPHSPRPVRTANWPAPGSCVEQRVGLLGLTDSPWNDITKLDEAAIAKPAAHALLLSSRNSIRTLGACNYCGRRTPP